LQEIANSSFDFDTTRKRKAQEIIDNWKVEQQILASESANQNIGTINNHCTTLGKRQNDDSERTFKEKCQDTGDRKTINEPVKITDDPKSDTQAINTIQNLDEKQVSIINRLLENIF
ncbi:11910_t:CDS:2, partial [Racocetra fulgida]